MRTFAEFQIIGHVGKVRMVGPTLRVDVAADYGRKDDKGQFQSNPYWNEVTLFNDRVIAWAKDSLKPGDLVHARGTLRQTRWEKDRQTFYGVTLAADDFDLLAPKAPAAS
ncbi:single-stranded DNA-binding protein [Rubellimicrobium aerolatum]|uniref:Single-stranded DNA-binding protein n=1 Tax=Rubellimicrobium aerolatum TaxID=490979 RepID=A0ABW0SE24_9RHOB|nr:single-stranded DNA-binding protein [Rubellimicrobium aerolatum]MBP1807001.1 single-stranded DNA-binding protein [Rubellimicrobium aerolatum]